ncbi:hypothetical protein FGO68_gene4481 [Halteria grandinella]|uniref:MsrB domain-containing protein n=1 Tax=Halteria grandinella TaxID=5974 RepID=A0A8J8NIZ9_HALGN|nr:hypothetical protein FGO68_gene4481 [Halteria grandinella]
MWRGNPTFRRVHYNQISINTQPLRIFSFKAPEGLEKKDEPKPKRYNYLSTEEMRVILLKGTEWPGTGALLDNKSPGTYICRQCNSPLYKSSQKFESGCGWPAFDDQIAQNVLRLRDEDGRRVEIVCANCEGHLGHVFEGERFTEKNTRHCVNSISMSFVGEGEDMPEVIKVDKK